MLILFNFILNFFSVMYDSSCLSTVMASGNKLYASIKFLFFFVKYQLMRSISYAVFIELVYFVMNSKAVQKIL